MQSLCLQYGIVLRSELWAEIPRVRALATGARTQQQKKRHHERFILQLVLSVQKYKLLQAFRKGM